MRKLSNTEKYLFWAVVGVKLAFLAGVLVIFGEGKLIWGDGSFYIEVGKNIWQHARFGTGVDGMSPETLFMPLYPIIIGFINVLLPHGVSLVSALQSFAAGLIALLTYRIALRFAPPPYALIAALILAFQPVAFLLNLLIMTETFAVLFLLLFVYLFLKYRETRDMRALALSALMLALALLVRNVMLYLFIIPLIYILFERWGDFKTRILHGILFLIIPLLLIAPWVTRNALLTGTASADFGGSNNICGYQLFATYAANRGVGIRTQFHTTDDQIFQASHDRCLKQHDLARLFTMAVDYPKGFVKANVLTTLAFFTNDGVSSLFQNGGTLETHHNYLTPMVLIGGDWKTNFRDAIRELSASQFILVFGLKLFWITMTILAAVGAGRALRGGNKREALFILLIIAYLASVTILSTAFGVGARLRYPIEPFLLTFAIIAIGVGNPKTPYSGAK